MSNQQHQFIEDLEPARAHAVWVLLAKVDKDPDSVIREAVRELSSDELRLFAVEAQDERGHDVASVLWAIQSENISYWSSVRAQSVINHLGL